ncbi:uncharacterized protein [Montipora capricornis]|uniref:uncharacterized protein isoform X2 n=1 Tax=Montipora capricornis TaxID=246305 RepID=UPI0035F1A651
MTDFIVELSDGIPENMSSITVWTTHQIERKIDFWEFYYWSEKLRKCSRSSKCQVPVIQLSAVLKVFSTATKMHEQATYPIVCCLFVLYQFL